MRRLSLASSQRVFAEQVRAELGDAGAHAVGVGGQVERPERADLAVAGDARVGLDLDDGAVEDRDRLAARPLVAALVQRQIDAVGADAGDLQGSPRFLGWAEADQSLAILDGDDQLQPGEGVGEAHHLHVHEPRDLSVRAHVVLAKLLSPLEPRPPRSSRSS